MSAVCRSAHVDRGGKSIIAPSMSSKRVRKAERFVAGRTQHHKVLSVHIQIYADVKVGPDSEVVLKSRG